MINKLLATSILFLFSLQSYSQVNEKDTILFSISELRQDFNYWRKHLTDKHPVIYHYNSPQKFNQYFDSVYLKIDHPMTKSDFFRIIGPTTSFIKCAHSQVYAGSEINSSIMDNKHLIPVNIEWLNDTAYVTYNYTNDAHLSPGTIITEINGVSIDDIYDQCLSLLPDDGHSKAYAKFWVNKQFYYYYHLMFGVFEDYSFSTQTSKTISTKVIVNGMSVTEMNSVELIKPKIVDDLFEGIDHYFIGDSTTAVLRVGSFFNSDYKRLHKKRYKRVVDENIKTIRNSNCQYLILDLRGNDGGQPKNPLYLLEHLMSNSFEFKHELRVLKDKNETDSFKRSKKTFFTDRRVGIFKPFDTHFQGVIYLIIDGGSTSAAAEFASVIHRYSRGKVIGTETGGNPIFLTGFGLGSYKKFPNTKLPFSFGKNTTLMNDEKLDNGYGLIPDVVKNPSIKDFFKGNNPSLEYILMEIEEFQKAQLIR